MRHYLAPPLQRLPHGVLGRCISNENNGDGTGQVFAQTQIIDSRTMRFTNGLQTAVESSSGWRNSHAPMASGEGAFKFSVIAFQGPASVLYRRDFEIPEVFKVGGHSVCVWWGLNARLVMTAANAARSRYLTWAAQLLFSYMY